MVGVARAWVARVRQHLPHHSREHHQAGMRAGCSRCALQLYRLPTNQMNNMIEIEEAEAIGGDTAVDHNPELADISNPEGIVYRFRWRVYAVRLQSGQRFIHGRTFTNRDEAEKLAQLVRERGVINTDYWSVTFPVYGSAAWQAEETANQRMHDSGPLAGTVRDI